jgi:hypothetical protein
MRCKGFLPVIIFFATILLLCSQIQATKSRLLGMGDLSIVIEDESNMINLWDFARNPVGLLEDEEGSVVRSDMLSEVHDTKDIRSAPGQPLSSMIGEGEVLRSSLSAIYRKDDNFALGVEGSFFSRESEFEDEKYEAEYPEVLFAFCKRLNSQSLIGADIGYSENTLKTDYKMGQSSDKRFENKRLQAHLGVGRELSEAVLLAALLGYDRNDVDADPYFFQSNSYNYWFSIESIVRLEQKIKLGLETKFNLRRKDFNPIRSGFENHYFTTLKLRGIYDLMDKLSLGIFYSHNELFSGYQYPLEWFSNPYYSEDFAVAHWSVGCSYKFGDNVLAGIEYHFRDFSEPRTYNYISGYKHESFNLGVEGSISEAWSIRGGFIRTGTNINPVTGMGERYQSTENILTLGSGYQPYGSSLILEFSYQYAFKEFEPWYGDLAREAKRHILSISFKMAL